MNPDAHDFCPPVRAWFERRFAGPTEPQRGGWAAIRRGEDTLIAAPTGSGKTLAAFLVVLDRLVRLAIDGKLEDQLEAVYVSPLRALSHDIHRNLEAPLAEIREEAERQGLKLAPIRVATRTGDTPQSERQAMLRKPPHVLVTTPESLYMMLTAAKPRELLRSARTVIVDEIHALARDKRGSHLSLTLERLEARAHQRPLRIGLSATQRPIEQIADFLVGGVEESGTSPACTIVDLGHQRDLDLAIEVPGNDDLQAVASKEQFDDLLDAIAGHIQKHETTLVFVNTRRLAERAAHQLGERLGEEHVAAHHGSLSRERRLKVEARLKEGRLKALVATASLELGIDIGSIDLVCQIGSPRSIATFLQRIGRSGHALGLRPMGKIFPTSRDELTECAALLRAARAGRLDAIHPPEAPLDILAQQIVALCADDEYQEDALFTLVKRAWPFRTLTRAKFDQVIDMLSQGFETPKGRRGAYLHRDRLKAQVRGRRGARLTAIMSGGAIAETGDYRVVLDPSDTLVGTVNEDWAIESMAGDIFLLGTHSWQIRRVESGTVRVVDAQGAPPTIPFWLGEAPARTEELSHEVSSLRAAVDERLVDGDLEPAISWLRQECALSESGAAQLARYVQAQRDAVGVVPTCENLLAERFFDEAGGMQLVIHSPWGARINRGFGLALRKRFCASFNLELQAAATDDAIVLSLGNPQTFPIESVPRFLVSKTVGDVLQQAFLGSPLFAARWRWNATRSLAVPRARGKGRVPFPIQRMQADDLLAAAFPDQAACQENVTFPIDIPDHPLVAQTMHDCLQDAADLPGLTTLLERMEAGDVRMHCIDTVEPSPFAHEILNARPYAFLDDAPLEERRTRAVALRHVLPDDARDLARLDPLAIARVRDEALPNPRDPDELYELLIDLVLCREGDLERGAEYVQPLIDAGRAARATLGQDRWIFAAEKRPHVEVLLPDALLAPEIDLPAALDIPVQDSEGALDSAARGHLAILGPSNASELATRLGATEGALEASLARLESRGIAVSGSFDVEMGGAQFCDRSLLARIHRYTITTLRKQIEPVSARDYLRFALSWQNLHPETRLAGEGGLLRVIELLSGFECAAAAWEKELLPARIRGYKPEMLDALCLGGTVAWGRISPRSAEAGGQPTKVTPIGVMTRDTLEELLHAAALEAPEEADLNLRGPAEKILDLLGSRGALFAREIETGTRLLSVQVEEGLKDLVARGRVTCDGFAPLRRLLGGTSRQVSARRRPGRMRLVPGGLPVSEGRWGMLAPLGDPPDADEQAEQTALRLLTRYGVIFRDLLAREWVPGGWRNVHRALRRLEARGQVRGGRFVSGFVGEQFALPEAVTVMRRARNRDSDDTEIRVSAADPLNLAGILTPGPRIPAGTGRWLILRDGLPIAVEDRDGRTAL